MERRIHRLEAAVPLEVPLQLQFGSERLTPSHTNVLLKQYQLIVKNYIFIFHKFVQSSKNQATPCPMPGKQGAQLLRPPKLQKHKLKQLKLKMI